MTNQKIHTKTKAILLAETHPLAVLSLAISHDHFEGMVTELYTQMLRADADLWDLPNNLMVNADTWGRAVQTDVPQRALVILHGLGPSQLQRVYPQLYTRIWELPSPKRIIFVHHAYTEKDYTYKTEHVALVYRQKTNYYLLSGNPQCGYLMEQYNQHVSAHPLSLYGEWAEELLSAEVRARFSDALAHFENTTELFAAARAVLQEGDHVPKEQRIIPFLFDTEKK